VIPAVPLASFDPVPDGYRFTLRYQPDPSCPVQGTVILVPAFAEEMNRCRRMTALTARRLAGQGWRVWMRDLLGCGDSSGDFGDASWQAWMDDLNALVDDVPTGERLWLWGVRAGALLIPDLLSRRPDADLLLWQPAMSGRTALTQFLRLKTASAAIAGKDRIEAKTLRERLLAGQAQEVAGYTISPSLAAGFDASSLDLPETYCGRIAWLEVAAVEPASLAPAGDGLRARWNARGIALEAEAVSGLQFWQTQETAECAALVDATEAAVRRLSEAVSLPKAGSGPVGIPTESRNAVETVTTGDVARPRLRTG
jgi:uncharacterized protein